MADLEDHHVCGGFARGKLGLALRSKLLRLAFAFGLVAEAQNADDADYAAVGRKHEPHLVESVRRRGGLAAVADRALLVDDDLLQSGEPARLAYCLVDLVAYREACEAERLSAASPTIRGCIRVRRGRCGNAPKKTLRYSAAFSKGTFERSENRRDAAARKGTR